MSEALAHVGLAHLAGQLAEHSRWDQRLSTGERQRFGLARAILHGPDVLMLDDALSALDAASQADLLRNLRKALPGTTIVSVGQTLPPAGLHDQVLKLTRRGSAPAISVRETDNPERVQ